MSDLLKDFMKANLEFARRLLANQMLGALSGDNALAAGILNAEPAPSGVDTPWGELPRQVKKDRQVWREGTKPIEGLEGMAGPAGAAGQAAGAAFNTSLGAQLDAAEAKVQSSVERTRSMLNFSASPIVNPKIDFPSVPNAGKSAALSSAEAKHAAFADAAFDTA